MQQVEKIEELPQMRIRYQMVQGPSAWRLAGHNALQHRHVLFAPPIFDRTPDGRGFKFASAGPMGFAFEGFLSLLIFADDLILFARTPGDLGEAYSEISALLRPAGLLLEPQKSEWTHNLGLSLSGQEDFLEAREAKLKRSKMSISQTVAQVRSLASRIRNCRQHLQKLDTPFLRRDRRAERKLLEVELASYQDDLAEAKRAAKTCQDEYKSVANEPFNPRISMKVEDTEISYIPPWRSMKVLGTMITGTGRTLDATDFALSRAWRAFWANKSILLNYHIDLLIRLKALQTFVFSVVSFNAGSWTPTKSDLARVRAAHLRMGRLMMRETRGLQEPWVEMLKRTADRMRKLLNVLKARFWDEAILAEIFNWAGHVSRYRDYHPLKYSHLLTLCWDGAYLDRIRAFSPDGRHLYRGHGRKPWRWESHLHAYFCRRSSLGEPSSWHHYANQISLWESFREPWIYYRKSNASNIDM